MKKLLVYFSLTFLVFSQSLAVTYNSDPKIFIEELAGDAIKILSDKSTPKEEKIKAIEKIALENVDIKALGLYSLGGIRKTLEPDQLEKYNELFKKYLLKSLTSRLSDYSSSTLKVIEADQKSATTTIVKSKIIGNDSQPEIKIDWRIYTKDPTKPLIRDLIVEGLSMARVQKEEFASVLNSNNNDINVLFSKLEEFISN